MARSDMQKLLWVDLTARRSQAIATPDWLQEAFVGGKGLGAKLMNDLTSAGVDPLAPECPLMFLTGPLTATAAPSMRACVVTKSPLTGTFLDSYFGGRFGPEIKYAGYDGIIITGRADAPVYLWIKDDAVELCPADAIWGQDALAANAAIKRDLAAPEATVVTIGQAGENRVPFALVSCEYNRQAGRGGAGAVMGAKNLKGVALQGSRVVGVHDLPAFRAACREAHAAIAANEECRTLTYGGTSTSVAWASEAGVLPVRNHADQVDPKADRLGDEAQYKHLFLGKAACFGCPIRCSQMGAIRTGKYAHQITDIVEFESAALLGSNLGIHDVRAVAHLTKLCDRCGIDSMSAGGIIGFAFEAARNGVLQAPDGVTLDFGSVAGAEYLLRAMALQENELGRLLSQGVKRAAEILDGGTRHYAMHVKGLEMPAWGPRGTPGMGLAYMTADRGGCHQRGFMIAYEVGGREYKGRPVPAHTIEGKAEILKGEQDYLAGTDTLVKCDFGAFAVPPEVYARLLQAATGRPVSATFFNELGERIWNQTRLFNLREGIKPEDDRLPRRIAEEPLPDGPHKGQRISAEDMNRMRADYYRVRGWDAQGRPTPQTLARLGLNEPPRFTLPNRDKE
ncbi:aldehyde ferredoxin oxidoreductase family protein [Desulfatitalea alkaliphila]|uniref:Aldehyde ferredoxin oxidoreductase family protein n=1 Tax=Desulfatitalea alkaliphila TaxID=2929485 RepID=A0AA41R0C9_9BACT|nr:aldehyde ferredoxin oxidoreductase family protein [Desulfatitalea alkaliphila]MCJ8499569.1 aldehyde ferredoxin oxidoreductase family protein [Desulfatitalea alkaliphila]